MSPVHPRRIALGLLPLVTIALLAACSPSGGGTGTDSKAVNIAYLSYTSTDFSAAIKRGVEAGLAERGGKVTLFTANFDPQLQLSQCQDAITSGRYQGILLAPVDPAAGVPCVEAAAKAGIPVVTEETSVGKDAFALEPQVKGVVAAIATPRKTQAGLDFKLLEQACEGKNPCEVISEVIGANDQLSTGRIAEVEKLAEGTGIVFTQRLVSGFDPAEITKGLPDLLSANPGTDVFFSISDQSAIAAKGPIADSKLEVASIGLGGSSEGVAAVKDGTIFGSIGNWPFQYGEFAAKALIQAASGEKVSPTSLNMLTADKPQLITKETVDDFTAEWGAGTGK